MRYFYHFEFCERPELPQWLREDVFASLGWVQNTFGLKAALTRDLPRVLSTLGVRKVFELGSGSGEGLAHVASASPHVEFVATDLFPNPAAWRERFSGASNLSCVEEPVAFENFERKLSLEKSALLLTSAFHHVEQRAAVDFLKRASKSGAHVLILEGLDRNPWGTVLGILAGLGALLGPFCVAKDVKRFLRMAFDHWLVPLVPLMLVHDGIVSSFRQRKRADWERLAQDAGYEFEWVQRLGLLRNFSIAVLRLNSDQGL